MEGARGRAGGDGQRQEVSRVATFEIIKDQGGVYRGRLRADNNEVIAGSSEGYTSKTSCKNGIKLVKKLAKGAGVEDQTIVTAPL
jgi:uncharacterized protein YegP (UPF0339 family)